MVRTDNHPTNECLEGYVFKRLSEPDHEDVEDHLLLCESCQVRLDQLEGFIRATREAALRLRLEDEAVPSESSFRGWLARSMSARPVWAATGACALLALGLMIPALRQANPGYREIALTTMRGAEPGFAPASPPSSGDWLRLRLDAQRLAPFETAQVLIVESGGRIIWQSGTVRREADAVTVSLNRKLAPGSYWVRLAAGSSPQVLREYQLQIK